MRSVLRGPGARVRAGGFHRPVLASVYHYVNTSIDVLLFLATVEPVMAGGTERTAVARNIEPARRARYNVMALELFGRSRSADSARRLSAVQRRGDASSVA